MRFTFTQAGAFGRGLNPSDPGSPAPLPVGALRVSGSFTLSAEAFASGLAVSTSFRAEASDLTRFGLLELAFTATYLDRP